MADEPEGPAEPNWWPGISLQAGITVHEFRNRVISSDLADAPLGSMQPIRPSATGSSAYVAPWLIADLEFMGPEIVRQARLRPFVHGGIGLNFGIERDIAKERTVGEFSVLAIPPGAMGTDVLENLVFGQGSKVSTETEPLFFTLGAGLSFEVDAMERTFRIKPSFEYVWERVSAEGTVHRAVLQIPNPTGLDGFRLVDLGQKEARGFHGIGPGLEIETDLSRKDDDKVLSVFASGSAYYFIGGRDFSFGSTNALGESAEFRVNRGAWSWRVGFGVRIRFEQ